MPCCSIPIIPRILSFYREVVPPKLYMLWINWILFSPSTQAKTSFLSSVIFLILDLVGRSLFKASWKQLSYLFPSSFEGSLVKCCFQLLDDIFLNWRLMNWWMKWRSLMPLAPFHTESMTYFVVVVAVVIFFIYLFVVSFEDTEQGGELSFWRLDLIGSRNSIMSSCWISGKDF